MHGGGGARGRRNGELAERARTCSTPRVSTSDSSSFIKPSGDEKSHAPSALYASGNATTPYLLTSSPSNTTSIASSSADFLHFSTTSLRIVCTKSGPGDALTPGW